MKQAGSRYDPVLDIHTVHYSTYKIQYYNKEKHQCMYVCVQCTYLGTYEEALYSHSNIIKSQEIKAVVADDLCRSAQTEGLLEFNILYIMYTVGMYLYFEKSRHRVVWVCVYVLHANILSYLHRLFSCPSHISMSDNRWTPSSLELDINGDMYVCITFRICYYNIIIIRNHFL